jgi:NADP-dependent aldehyde dehydrogenase
MPLTGGNFIGFKASRQGRESFHAMVPGENRPLEPGFACATEEEIDAACQLARQAYEQYRQTPHEQVRTFLERIAAGILELGEELIGRCGAETALPRGRLESERQRTVNQLRMFAALVGEGSWVDARIDRADPLRKPAPRPDIRRMLVPVGPVAVFGAANFPLAFSTAGGDTASALAAGCPVVYKGHPSHPGTSELIAGALLKAAKECGIPDGVFSLINGTEPKVGLRLARHPAIQAVAFTGSQRAGMALYEAAAARDRPIPVFAEMGSVNPVFILPDALSRQGETIAEELMASVNLGVGQFCTSPGLIFAINSPRLDAMIERMSQLASATHPAPMLNQRIGRAYCENIGRLVETRGVTVFPGEANASGPPDGYARAVVAVADFDAFLSNPALREEIFGPATLVVRCRSTRELEQAARSLPGGLTATMHAEEADDSLASQLMPTLRESCGRLIWNGYPTGVEVCPAMQHGGPYPATSDSRFSSVGATAILRFVRPVAYQNVPDALLPVELRNRNMRGIWRLLDGEWTRADVS